MRSLCLAFVFLASWSFAQVDGLSGEATLEFREQSWFDDELGTAVLYVTAKEEPVVALPRDDAAIRFFGAEVLPLKEDERGTFAVVIEFQPRQVGLSAFPAIRLESGGEVWESPPRQILVGATRVTAEMELMIKPAKHLVYAGEPVRVDFGWRSAIPFKQLRDFRLSPEFFSDASVKVVVPRSQAPEDEQIGIPVGSRRIIGREATVKDAAGVEWLEVEFSVFLKFEEAGEYSLPPTRLSVSRLLRDDASSNRYAAYFSNGLFERVGREEAYEKLEAFSEALSVAVLPLPEKGRAESFSGLFAPVAISVSGNPDTLQVGQLMELKIELESEVAAEMLELPPLSTQAGLRHRFWVGKEVNRTWRPDGRLFTARLRPLTTEARYLPSFEFQIFNPETGDYEMRTTRTIPLSVEERDGRRFFAVSEIPGLTSEVMASADGIWHNKKANTMNELVNNLVGLMADGFWWLLILGPVLFFAFLPWARERRRRALDEEYKRRHEAYEVFRRSLSSRGDPVAALTRFVAECYGAFPSAFTAGDATRLLRKSGADDALIAEVSEWLRAADPERYASKKRRESALGNPEPVGERIFRLLSQPAALLALFYFLNTEGPSAMATDWTHAESLFSEALALAEQSVDSGAIESKFAAAALEFESCAKEGQREGIAWYNAGNAWFKAGELGRAIAGYRRAQAHRPFDEELSENLRAARALRVDVFGEDRREPRVPFRWVLAATAASWLVLCVVGVFWIRYRGRWSKMLLALSAGVFALLAVASLNRSLGGKVEAVLIVDESYGRKGPGYAYASAFSGPLHNGIEFRVTEGAERWLKAQLPDGSVCWLPAETVEQLSGF